MKTYQDVYELPLRQCEFSSWVYDTKNNFVFQFENGKEEERQLMIKVINGTETLKNKDIKFDHQEGYILMHGKTVVSKVILIRGWGNLTGCGAMNLPAKEAANIQDTFAEFIVNQLNKRV